jgi:LysM repeat protein
MKKTLLFVIILFCSTLVFAQNELLLQSNDKGLYLSHTVSPKENFYSIGRLYNVSPKEIAAYNSLDMNKGLTIGQKINIPLNAGNFSQASAKGRPVYYVVGAKEGLYRVSMKNNKVLMANLRKWNSLNNDNISTGEKLIVGYLVSPEANKIVVSNSEPEKKQPAVEEPKETVAQNQESGNEKETVNDKKDAVVEKKQEPEKKPESNVGSVTKPVSNTTTPVLVNDGNGGYFKSQYDQQIRAQPAKVDETATSGIFKTASGWQDGKFYALMDHVEPGTIIRIINPTNNKAIYAKVLGEMSGIRQNQGYDLRMSNAAAATLDISETDKFIVRINY